MSGWESVHVDDLEAINVAGVVWRPLRRRFGIRAFGTNVYTSEGVGKHIVEEHDELGSGAGGHEEMYVVLRGRATFTLGDDEVDAPAGTIVYAQPGTRRGAIAAEDGTAVLAVGAKPGVVFEPSPWEDIFVANAYADKGDLEGARALMATALENHPDAWQGYFNAACLEARAGDPERAFDYLQRSIELEPEAREYAQKDSDFDSIRDDERFKSLVAGQPDSGG